MGNATGLINLARNIGQFGNRHRDRHAAAPCAIPSAEPGEPPDALRSELCPGPQWDRHMLAVHGASASQAAAQATA